MKVRYEADNMVGLNTDVGDLNVSVREFDGQRELVVHFLSLYVEEMPRIAIVDARGNTYDWDNPVYA